MNPTPRRRWYQFSLRTMFVGVTLVCVVLAWVGYSLNWIKERNQRYGWAEHSDATNDWRAEPFVGAIAFDRAPFGLWLLGETGIVRLAYFGPPERIDEARRLFPEADVVDCTER